MAEMVTYQSAVNGIKFDVPAAEITNDFLNHPDKQMFVRPLDDVATSDMGQKSAVPERKSRAKSKAKSKAVVEVE